MSSQGKYQFSYNSKGAIIPPHTMETPFGLVLAMSAFLLPVIPHLGLPHEGRSPFLIQYLPSFWALRKAGLVSDSDLALFEMSTMLYLLARAAYFPFFWKRYISFFSEGSPPPFEMSRLWPSQISGSFKVGAVAIAASFTFGVLAYFENILSAKSAFCILEIFGAGWIFLSEGLIGFGLYLTFKLRFWRQTSFATHADEKGAE